MVVLSKQIRDQIYHSLCILYNIWSKALLFFEPRLLTIFLIAMYCNGDIKKSIEVSILFKQNFVMPNNFYLKLIYNVLTQMSENMYLKLLPEF